MEKMREARFETETATGVGSTATKLTSITHEIEKREQFRTKTFSAMMLFAILMGVYATIAEWDGQRSEAFFQLTGIVTIITIAVQTLSIRGLRKERDNLSARLLGEAGSKKGY